MMDPTPATAAEQTAPSGAGNAPAVLKVDPASQYRKNATLSEIFGPHVQPGRELLDVITKTYKAERVRDTKTKHTQVIYVDLGSEIK